jgi:hypothetical protein
MTLFIEAFASIVRRTGNENNGFLIALFAKRKMIRKLTVVETNAPVALPIVQEWLDFAAALAKGNTAQELLAVLARLPLHGPPVAFEKHPPVFGGDVEKTWEEWARLLFSRACKDELQSIQALKAQIDARSSA